MATKNYFFIVLYFFSAHVFSGVVNDKNNTEVDDLDLAVLLETAPIKEQKKLLEDKPRLINQIKKLYIKKALARIAIKDGVDKIPINATRLQTLRDGALYILQLDKTKKLDKKDYSKIAKQQYSVNKSDYKVDERIDAAHILITMKKRPEEVALEKANKIRKELLAGADFSIVAIRESDDVTVKSNHGELGAFTKAQLVPEFTDIAFSLKSGEISEPVKTIYGYHLIKLNKKVPAGFLSFDEVKSGIIEKIRAENWKIDSTEYLDKLKKDNEMQIDDDALNIFIENKLEELEKVN